MLPTRRSVSFSLGLGASALFILAPEFGCGSSTSGPNGEKVITSEEGKAQAAKANTDFYKSLPPGKGGARPRR